MNDALENRPDQPVPLLLVDDNNGMLETLADILAVGGFEVATALDAEHALSALEAREAQARPFAVAVIDLVLPGMNGVELVRRLKARYAELKLIAITAYSDTELARQARAEGVDTMLYKPLDPDELVTAAGRLAGIRE